MSGDNDVVCVLWICVVVGTESYVCDQLPKLPEEPPPIGDCANPQHPMPLTVGSTSILLVTLIIQGKLSVFSSVQADYMYSWCKLTENPKWTIFSLNLN